MILYPQTVFPYIAHMLYHYLEMMRMEDKETSKDWEFLLNYLTESFKAEGRPLEG